MRSLQARTRAALSTGAAAAFLTGVAPGQTPDMSPPPSHEVELNFDSGIVRNAGNEMRVVWSTVVEVPGAEWLRLNFDQAQLAFDWTTGRGSALRVTSLDDGATQTLNAATMLQWGNTSAYFNGDAVSVELLGAPGGAANRISIDRATAGDPPVDPDSICGATDDRMLSEDVRAARAMPVGCTAWIIDDGANCFLTAGHCMGSLSVVEFNVPLSNREGGVLHPPPEDQYPVDPESRQFRSNSIGDDWGYFGAFRNTETGLRPADAQGDWYHIAQPPEVNGQTIRITGYGTVSPPVPLEWSQVQKTHTGGYVERNGTTLRYQVDTSGGNSGSPVINEDTGEAIGIHTHAGCQSGGGANHGTGLNHTSIQAALAAPRGLCAAMTLGVDTLFGGQPVHAVVNNATPGEAVYFIYSLAGEGKVFIPALNVTLGLAQPALGGSVIADPEGRAEFVSEPLPDLSRIWLIWLQAAEIGRVSDVIATQIN